MNKIKKSFFLMFIFCAQSLMGDLNVITSLNSTNGDCITAWENYNGTGNNIYASIQTGGTWGSSVAIGNEATNPRVPLTAINNSSQKVVIWIGTDVTTSAQSLYGSTYSSGTWTTSLLSDPTYEIVMGNYDVKIANNGAIVVTWMGLINPLGTYEARGIYAPTYGTWPAAVTIP